MSDSERDGRRELTWMLTEEAQAAADRIAAGIRSLEGAGPGGAPELHQDALQTLRASVRALQAALGKMLDMHGALRSVARPERVPLDAVGLAWEVAEEATAEGVDVRVEAYSRTGVFHGDVGELRRILRLLIERAASTAEAGPWIVLGVTVTSAEVIYEVPWNEVVSTADVAERDWLVRAVRRQTGTLTTAGGCARVVLPIESEIQGSDSDALRVEVDALRRQSEVYVHELDAVRRQGETYARELAEMFSAVEVRDAALGRATARLAAAQRMAIVGNLAAGIAHEVRQILEPIARHARSLAEHGAGPQSVGERILREVQGGTGFLSRLVDYSHTADGVGEEPTDVAAEARLAALRTEELATARDVRLELRLPETPVVLKVAPAAFEGVVSGLLRGALEAVAAPGGLVRLTVHRTGEGRVLVGVEDNGTPPAEGGDLRAFEPFAAPRSGREDAMTLFAAWCMARRHQGVLLLGGSELGGLRVVMELPGARPGAAPDSRRPDGGGP